MELKIGSAIATEAMNVEEQSRLLLWGASGCGKTVLAYTAPKPILGIQWDTGGSSCLITYDGIEIIDLSGQGEEITDKFKDSKSQIYKDIEKYIVEKGFASIVVDSCTTFGNKALQYGVSTGQKFVKGGKEIVTAENPGFTGYNIKNMLVNRLIMNMLTLSVKTHTHLVVIAHEDLPDKDKDGNIVQQTIMLGSSLAYQIPVDFGEVWHMEDTAGRRYISIRPKGIKKPMKTRMFDNRTNLGFHWKYDQIQNKGITLESIYNEWKKNGYKKMQPPANEDVK